MEDREIVELYLSRDENAVKKTSEKYGAYCLKIARNILSAAEDAEECVSEAYYKAWISIPPERPESLGAWLGAIVRNTALDMFRKSRRQKRFQGAEEILDELSDCVPSPENVERELDVKELTEKINSWLEKTDRRDRRIFVQRYFLGDPVKLISEKTGEPPEKISKRLSRLRQKLRKELEKEGYTV